METLRRNTCQRIRCLHLSHRSFLSHYLTYLTTLTILTLTYPAADLHIEIDMFCNQHLSPLPGSKQLDAMRLANQQLCLRLSLQVAIALFTNVQSINKNPNESLPILSMLSVETQHTIGYGGRQTTEECPEAIAVMSFQVTSFTNKQKQIKIYQCYHQVWRPSTQSATVEDKQRRSVRRQSL